MNQFGGQEPGTEEQIQGFCSGVYEVTFPMFRKIDVNGPRTHPLFALLKTAKKGLLGSESIKWNFTKFLVGPDGTVLHRYGSNDTPEKIEKDVVSALSLPASAGAPSVLLDAEAHERRPGHCSISRNSSPRDFSKGRNRLGRSGAAQARNCEVCPFTARSSPKSTNTRAVVRFVAEKSTNTGSPAVMVGSTVKANSTTFSRVFTDWSGPTSGNRVKRKPVNPWNRRSLSVQFVIAVLSLKTETELTADLGTNRKAPASIPDRKIRRCHDRPTA